MGSGDGDERTEGELGLQLRGSDQDTIHHSLDRGMEDVLVCYWALEPDWMGCKVYVRRGNKTPLHADSAAERQGRLYNNSTLCRSRLVTLTNPSEHAWPKIALILTGPTDAPLIHRTHMTTLPMPSAGR